MTWYQALDMYEWDRLVREYADMVEEDNETYDNRCPIDLEYVRFEIDGTSVSEKLEENEFDTFCKLVLERINEDIEYGEF